MRPLANGGRFLQTLPVLRSYFENNFLDGRLHIVYARFRSKPKWFYCTPGKVGVAYRIIRTPKNKKAQMLIFCPCQHETNTPHTADAHNNSTCVGLDLRAPPEPRQRSSAAGRRCRGGENDVQLVKGNTTPLAEIKALTFTSKAARQAVHKF